MGALRYELSEGQWRRIEPLLPGRLGTVGRPAEDNRRFVNGVLWVVRSGMRWEDLPERYGKYKSVHKRFPAGHMPEYGTGSLPIWWRMRKTLISCWIRP